MKIERIHNTAPKLAKRTIDRFLDELMKRKFEKVTIKKPKKQWSGNRMEFSFQVQKGMKWANIKGYVLVDGTKVILEGQLGIITRQFISDEEIECAINEQFDKIFKKN